MKVLFYFIQWGIYTFMPTLIAGTQCSARIVATTKLDGAVAVTAFLSHCGHICSKEVELSLQRCSNHVKRALRALCVQTSLFFSCN